MNNTDTIIPSELTGGPRTDPIYGLTYDGDQIWAAQGQKLISVDPQTGQTTNEINTGCDAGVAFDGQHIWKLSGESIHKISKETGEVLSSIDAPGEGSSNSGLAWAENSLWVGQFKDRKIYQISPDDGKILKTINSDRYVTGVTWLKGDLWHATWEDEQSELRKINKNTGEVEESYRIESKKIITGLTHDNNQFYAGGGDSGSIRTILNTKKPTQL